MDCWCWDSTKWLRVWYHFKWFLKLIHWDRNSQKSLNSTYLSVSTLDFRWRNFWKDKEFQNLLDKFIFKNKKRKVLFDLIYTEMSTQVYKRYIFGKRWNPDVFWTWVLIRLMDSESTLSHNVQIIQIVTYSM